MKPISRWVFLLAAITVLSVVVLFNMTQITMPGPPSGPGSSAPANQSPPEDVVTSSDGATQEVTSFEKPMIQSVGAAPDVSVIRVLPAAYEAEVSGFGVARPQYELNLKSQVTGQVTSITNSFETGLRLKKGDRLLTLDDSNYLTAFTSAKSGVAEAKLKLLEAEREAIEARAEWKATGLKGSPTSELVLHAPQLKAAKTVLKNAEAALTQAQRDLKQTKLTSPFDALVVERLVTPGSFVQTGADVATLYGSRQVHIEIALPAADWKNLPESEVLTQGDWPAVLSSVNGGQSWLGHVHRVEQHLDEVTRQRALIVSVDDPLDLSPALLPGTFLKVSIKGKRLEGLWKLPNSALSQRGEVWYVNSDNRLDSVGAKVVFSKADSIFVYAPDEFLKLPQSILISPLNSYLKGMQVSPVSQTNTAGKAHD